MLIKLLKTLVYSRYTLSLKVLLSVFSKGIIDSFIDNSFQVTQLASINRCRLYLQVIHLSDITTGDGYRIDKSSYAGSVNKCLHTKYLWPVQSKPGNADWKEWRKSITIAFFVVLIALILPISYQLNEWDDEIPITRWYWCYDESTDTLYNSIKDILVWQYTTVHSR